MNRSALIAAFLIPTASACEAESGLASYYRGERSWWGNDLRSSHQTIGRYRKSYWRRAFDALPGPFVRGRVIDVSMSAARALGMMRSGVIHVSVE